MKNNCDFRKLKRKRLGRQSRTNYAARNCKSIKRTSKEPRKRLKGSKNKKKRKQRRKSKRNCLEESAQCVSNLRTINQKSECQSHPV